MRVYLHIGWVISKFPCGPTEVLLCPDRTVSHGSVEFSWRSFVTADYHMHRGRIRRNIIIYIHSECFGRVNMISGLTPRLLAWLSSRASRETLLDIFRSSSGRELLAACALTTRTYIPILYTPYINAVVDYRAQLSGTVIPADGFELNDKHLRPRCRVWNNYRYIVTRNMSGQTRAHRKNCHHISNFEFS